jgi:hypothetical protein
MAVIAAGAARRVASRAETALAPSDRATEIRIEMTSVAGRIPAVPRPP